MTDEDAVIVQYGHRLHPLLHLVRPLVTAAALWGAREAIDGTYRRISGRTAP